MTTTSKVLTLIPIIVFAVTVACLIPLTVSYLSTGSDATAMALVFAVSFFLIFTPLPCLVMAVIGTVYAARSKREGITSARKFFVIGLIEIIICIPGVLCGIIAAIFTAIRW